MMPGLSLPDPKKFVATSSAVSTAVVLAVIVVLLARWGPDWPAQEFRAWLGARNGWALYTTRWYSGDSVLGYSVLYPSIAGAIGAGPLGVLSCAATTWAGTGLAPRSGRLRPECFGIAIAVATMINLLIGQVPFLLGTAFAVTALRVVLGGRPLVIAATAAMLTSLASPLCGAFLLLTVPALALTLGWRRSSPLLAASAGSLVAAVVGGAGGYFPCPWQTLLGVVGFCIVTALLAPAGNKGLRVFAASYLLVAAVVFLVPNPVGGNIARLGKIVAIPLVVYLMQRRPMLRQGRRQRIAFAVVVALAIVWPGEGMVSSVARGARDPSAQARFYLGIDHYLAHHLTAGQRVEVPFTREHWEAYYLARHVPIARGWDRQSDLEYNAVLYQRLTPARYRTWLDANSVAFVALPSAPIDFGGRAEAALLLHPPAYLSPVWRSTDWQIWKVAQPSPMVSGPARITDEDPTSLTLRFDRPGTALVRYRSTQLWRSTSAQTTVTATAGGWTRVASRSAGLITLTVGLGG